MLKPRSELAEPIGSKVKLAGEFSCYTYAGELIQNQARGYFQVLFGKLPGVAPPLPVQPREFRISRTRCGSQPHLMEWQEHLEALQPSGA